MENSIQTILIWLTIGFLWWFFNWPYKAYLKDLTRQRMFAVRDDLFVFVAKSKDIDFKHPAYRFARMRFNSAIRHIDTLSITNFLIFAYNIEKDSETKEQIREGSKEIKNTMKSLSFENKRKLLEAENMLHGLMLLHIVKTSVFLAPIFWLFKQILKAADKFDSYRRKVLSSKQYRKFWERADYHLYKDDPEAESLTG